MLIFHAPSLSHTLLHRGIRVLQRGAPLVALVGFVSLAACKTSSSEVGSSTEKSSPASSASSSASASSSSSAAATDELGRYKADLAERKVPNEDAQEAVGLRLGPWKFFYRGGSAEHPMEAAGVTASGEIVSLARRNDWYKLLTVKAPEKEIAARFAWILGGAVVITDGAALTDPQAKALIKPPETKVDGDGTIHINMFVVRPPDIQNPSRLHIGSPTSGRGYFDDAGWRNLIGQ